MQIKRYILLMAASVFLVYPLRGAELKDYILSSNTYVFMSVNVDKLRACSIYPAIKTNLGNKIKNSDIVSSYFPAEGEPDIKDDDISLIALSVDVLENKPMMKESLSYMLAIRLTRDLSADSLVKMLTNDPSGKAEFKVTKIKRSLMEIIEISSRDTKMFVYMPDKRTIFISDTILALINAVPRYKAGKPLPVPPRLEELHKTADTESTILLISAIPPAIKAWLEDEEAEMAKNSNPQDIIKTLQLIMKNIKGITICAEGNESLNFELKALFLKSDAAIAMNGLVKQYLPLLKIQIFMMAQNNTQMPFLNTLVNSVKDNDFILTFSLGANDINALFLLSEQNAKIKSF